jgi:hypothetical protein
VSPRFTRFEIVAVLIVLAIGFGLRAAYPARMAVEHFDEGVYASDLYSPLTDERYPAQQLYAPPLLPTLLYWAAVFGGSHAVMWVNVLAGSATLVVVWWMVRSWWGPSSALAVLAILALDPFHIAFSRAALTDVLLGLWMTAGVAFGVRAVAQGGWGNILAAGVFASVAWWTKYNGWLTLAITGAGTAGWLVGDPILCRVWRRRSDSSGAPVSVSSVSTALGRWAVTAVIAVAGWLPWLWKLRQYGGYGPVAKNHAGYFTGLENWLANAGQQLAAIAHFDFVVIAFTASVVVGLSLAVGGRAASNRDPIVTRSNHSLANWTLAAWLIGLSVAVPLYRPYPRLILPWMIAAAVVAGGVLSWFAGRLSRRRDAAAVGRASEGAFCNPEHEGLCWLALLPLAALASFLFKEAPFPAWQDRRSLQTCAGQIIERLRSEPLPLGTDDYRTAIYVLAEPGLFFHLAAAQSTSPIDHLTQAASDYGMAAPGGHRSAIPAFLVTGPHAPKEELERLITDGRVTPLAEFDYHPSDLVLLDDRPAWELPAKEPERIRLFHVKVD